MGIRTQKFTPFQGGQQTGTRMPGESVKIGSDTSKMKRSAASDPLRHALGGFPPDIPNRYHLAHPSKFHAKGANYNPAGEFGRVARTGAGRGVYSYGGNRHSAPSANAIGSPPNRKGQNALGSPPNRRGINTNGNPPNHIGENALASQFRPRTGGGGRHV